MVEDINQVGWPELRKRQAHAESALMKMGITFTVYGDTKGTERIFPFDVIPRVIVKNEWRDLERGLRQRAEALNQFIADIYGAQRILREGHIPSALVLGNPAYRPQCQGMQPPLSAGRISGTDLIRHKDGKYYVLEDNLRCPSGVSYVLENRDLMKKVFPQSFARLQVAPVDDYPARLLAMLQDMAPPSDTEPTCVVLTPGIYNSAYYEHSYLAREMGIELVEGSDLVVENDGVYMRTTGGLERACHLPAHRRVLGPEAFRPDSVLGVPDLMRAYLAGNVAIVNAPSTGVADDKAVYTYVPDMIRFYLSEEPILNNVPTYRCREPKERQHVLNHLDQLVVKAVDGAGGYGMLMAPCAESRAKAFAAAFKKTPITTSHNPRCPCLGSQRWSTKASRAAMSISAPTSCAARTSTSNRAVCQVALRKGSLVVNSSGAGQGYLGTPPVNQTMLSRVAANIHWMARYVERADNLVRFLQVNLNLQFEYPDARAAQWEPLIQTTGDQAWFFENYGQATRENVIRALSFDPDYANSIISVLSRARKMPEPFEKSFRGHVATQRTVAHGFRRSRKAASGQRSDRVVRPRPTHDGSIFGSPVDHDGPGEAWHFYRLGELIERSDKTSRILDVKYFMLSPRLRAIPRSTIFDGTRCCARPTPERVPPTSPLGKPTQRRGLSDSRTVVAEIPELLRSSPEGPASAWRSGPQYAPDQARAASRQPCCTPHV